jgi:hypothetical protein
METLGLDAKLKHLEFIQGVIDRMARCSFLLKGWSVILVSGLFALAAKESHHLLLYAAFWPATAFWFLDGYYLSQERLFRRLYDVIRKQNPADITFDMDTSACREKGKTNWWACVRSKTVVPFHGSLVFTIMVVTITCMLTKG